ncbi:MAG: SHOCT domain-containing protein [Gammaproteobacteria bacterium]|nr:SHOCT domain-containing protein [Gammaproteobacteria bacterium]
MKKITTTILVTVFIATTAASTLPIVAVAQDLEPRKTSYLDAKRQKPKGEYQTARKTSYLDAKRQKPKGEYQTATAPAAAPSGSSATAGQKLIDLNRAREAGAITDEEYEVAKKKLLDSQ